MFKIWHHITYAAIVQHPNQVKKLFLKYLKKINMKQQCGYAHFQHGNHIMEYDYEGWNVC